MAGAERDANGPPAAGPRAASVQWRWRAAVVVPCLLIGLGGLCAQSDPAAAVLSTKPAEVLVPRPSPPRSPMRAPPAAPPTDERPAASPAARDAGPPPEPLEPPSPAPPSLEPARLAPASEERAVLPPPAAEPLAEVEEEPEPMTDAERPATLLSAAELAKAAAGTFVPAQRATLAIELLQRTLRSLDPRKLNAAELAQRIRRMPGEAPAPAQGTPVDTVVASSSTSTEAPGRPAQEDGMLDLEALDRIRLEIKSRLPYFQACADASRRRGGPDVRRLQAVWSVGPDGAIKELRLENVSDPQLAGCITRMGSHPFAAKPGTDLTIPTPIVFVR